MDIRLIVNGYQVHCKLMNIENIYIVKIILGQVLYPEVRIYNVIDYYNDMYQKCLCWNKGY